MWDPAVHPSSWRAVWAYSRKRAVRDSATLTLQENRAKAVVAGETSRPHPTVRQDHERHHRPSTRPPWPGPGAWSGSRATSPTSPPPLMPAAEVIASYHDCGTSRQSFRMSKTDLAARPMFHHTRDAIEAHLTIVFAALAVARYLQDATGPEHQEDRPDPAPAPADHRPHRRPRAPCSLRRDFWMLTIAVRSRRAFARRRVSVRDLRRPGGGDRGREGHSGRVRRSLSSVRFCMAKAGYPVIEKGQKNSVYDYAGFADSASA